LFEEGNEDTVEGTESDERGEGFGSARERPVLGDHGVFTLSRPVTVLTKVVADPFNTLEKIFAFLGIERKPEFDKDSSDTFKVAKESATIVREKENIINYLTVAALDSTGAKLDERFVKFNKALFKESTPFGTHDTHEKLGSKDDKGAPSTGGLESNPFILEESDCLSGNNLSFMDTIMRLSAGDGGGSAGVDAELVVDDRPADAFSDKGIPAATLNNRTDFGGVMSGKVSTGD
jgi:hypothetical protein